MRALAAWIGAFLVVALAGGGAVVALNATVFGPGDFVRVYLDALARGDAESALALPGVDPGIADDRLLTDAVLGGLDDIRQVRDEPQGGGVHRITMAWSTGAGDGLSTRDGQSTFEVERVGTRLGLFPEWGFAVSPTATIELEVSNDQRFTANGVQQVTGRPEGGAAALAVLVPGAYLLGHDSAFLVADQVTVVADEPGAAIPALIEVEPAPEFAAAITRAVHDRLAECVLQTVLFPTGCPFGHAIADRVVSDPDWSIVRDPAFSEPEPGAFGEWIAGPAPGTAHLTVEVQSLFDGSVSTLDQDVPFQARYRIRIVGDELEATVLED
ncbi:MAG: hypothetical protein R2717_02070 [Schumannella sp.]